MNINQPIAVIGTNSWGSALYEKALRGDAVADSVIRDAVAEAIRQDLPIFDTAQDYGFGKGQKMIGEFCPKDQTIISAKYTPVTKYKQGQVHASLEKDLKDLGRDSIDIYWLHLPNNVEENMKEIIDLYKEGKIRAVGISNFNLEECIQVKKMLDDAGIPLYGVQNHYSLLDRTWEENGLTAWCRENGVSFWAWAVLEEGILAGPKSKSEKNTIMKVIFSGKRRKLNRLFRLMKVIGDRHNITIAQVAIAYVANKGLVPICGCRKPYQVTQLKEAAETRLSTKEIRKLEEVAAEGGTKILEADAFRSMVKKTPAKKESEKECPVTAEGSTKPEKRLGKRWEPKHKPTKTFSVEKDGFYGLYYEPEVNRFPGKGMVICTGSDGSFLLCKLGADWFLDAGMPVIALGYFNCPGTPDDPLECPVEYMQKACRWLKEEKGLHVGVWGISLGGEYALLCGSMFPEIECVVAASPVHVVTQCGSFNGGLHFCMGSPFSYEGKPIPCVMPAPTEKMAKKIVHRMLRSFARHMEPDMLFFYTETLSKPHPEETDIPVEKIGGPVLLVSGAEDVMVPSNWTCEQALQRIKAHDPQHVAVHKNYEYMSHYACPLRPATSAMFRVERRYKDECSASRTRMWQDTLEFLHDTWTV